MYKKSCNVSRINVKIKNRNPLDRIKIHCKYGKPKNGKENFKFFFVSLEIM